MTLEQKFHCEFEGWISWVLWAGDQVEMDHSGMVLDGAAGDRMYHLNPPLLYIL